MPFRKQIAEPAALACVASKRAKATSAFALEQYDFSYICPYHFILPY